MPNDVATSFQALFFVTSTKPPRSRTNKYSRNKSSGFFDMVGHAEIGLPFSSMKRSNWSRNFFRSGLSSKSYRRAKASPALLVFYNSNMKNKNNESAIKNVQDATETPMFVHLRDWPELRAEV